MATLVFRVSAQYDEVIKLRNEISKLEAQLKKMDVNKSPASAKALETQLASTRQQMMGLVTEAAKAGAVMEKDFKSNIYNASQSVNDFTQKIIDQKRVVKDEDTVVVPGDISWGMNFSQSLKDFEFLNKLPGRKIISKGNHDYWWNSMTKMNNFFAENGFDSLNILHNNHYAYDNIGICGTRGWINDNSVPADKKVLDREAGRLTASIESALKANLKPVVFLHYPPVYLNDKNAEILEVLHKYGIKQCYYGHFHGKAIAKTRYQFYKFTRLV